MAYQKGKGLTSRWRVWLNSAFASLCLQTIISDPRVNVTSAIKITLASRTFTSVLLIDHNRNQYNKATCKQMQQLPTMLGPAVHRRIRIHPIRLWRPCVMIVCVAPANWKSRANGSKIVAQSASKKAAKIYSKYLSAKFIFLIPQEVL